MRGLDPRIHVLNGKAVKIMEVVDTRVRGHDDEKANSVSRMGG